MQLGWLAGAAPRTHESQQRAAPGDKGPGRPTSSILLYEAIWEGLQPLGVTSCVTGPAGAVDGLLLTPDRRQ